MHPKNRALLGAFWEKFFAFNGTGDYVANDWILLWKVRCEIHLLPKRIR
jgi:hypothetical protein